LSSKQGLYALATVLCLVGAMLLIVSGVLGFLGSAIHIIFSPIASLGGMFRAVIEVILGLFALLGLTKVKSATWDIILVVVGFIGGGVGGALVLIGALIALVLHYVEL